MTEDSKSGRIDLRVLELSGRAGTEDAIIANAIAGSARMRGVPAADAAVDLKRYLRPALLAAGILIVIAAGAVRTIDNSPRVTSPVSTIAEWTETHYVPSDGELLAAFQGYGK
ncbi:MAG TPA: hypothetical protein VGD02_12720 [Gemmatimonadaceae bacterium]